MDFSTPTGQVFLAMVGAFSQFYSDNLSHETKKGWAERKAQGLYCGPLPFGAMKGEDGVPVPNMRESEIGLTTYEGLKLAFEGATQGQSDGQIARRLNALGFRTAGSRGRNPFSKDSVRRMLTNRFYLASFLSSRRTARWKVGLREHICPSSTQTSGLKLKRRGQRIEVCRKRSRLSTP
jgi:hypothetical protein